MMSNTEILVSVTPSAVKTVVAAALRVCSEQHPSTVAAAGATHMRKCLVFLIGKEK